VKVADKAKEVVVVEGFLLSVASPTEDRLAILVDASKLSWREYRDLILRLQAQLAEVDDIYKKREVRGRGLRARYRRISWRGEVSRKRVLNFIPYPSRFANVLRAMRRDLYAEINSQCLVLQMLKLGAYRRNVYLLPYSRAPSFMAYIEKENGVIKELNEEVKEFRETPYFADIRNTLEEAGLDVSVLDVEVYLSPISVDLTPLRLDPTVIEEFVESKYKEVFERISEEERRGLEALRRELERKRRELVVKSIENLRDQVNGVVKRMLARKRLKRVKEDLERLRDLAADVGLKAVAVNVISPLIDVVENPEKADEIFGTTDLTEGVDGRIRGLISSL